jgi:M6 family metalloprotease-like protein
MSNRKIGAQGAKEVFFSPLRLLAAIFVSSLFLSGAFAQGSSLLHESQRAAQVRELNNRVLQLHGQAQENQSAIGAIRSQAATVLAQRSAAIQALMQEDAHAALTFAFSPELLADLAEKFPASASTLESHVTLSGPIEHWVSDSVGRKSSHDSWFLNVAGSKLSLYFPGPQHPDPKISANVTVEGVQLGSNIAVSRILVSSGAAGSSSILQMPILNSVTRPGLLTIVFFGFLLLLRRVVQVSKLRQFTVVATALIFLAGNPGVVSAQATCSTLGVQKTLVLLGLPSGATAPVTPQQVHDVFFDTATGRSLNGYWQEASYGQASASGDVMGWYSVSGSYTCSTLSQMFNDTMTAAANAGVNFSNYTRIFFVYPDLSPSCGFDGFAQVGCYSLSTPSGTVSASVAYVVAGNLVSRDNGVSLVAHEGGHELGLLHAGSLSYAPETLGPVGTSGTVASYGDWFSTMGSAQLALYSAPHKAEILGWMAKGVNYQVVQTSGTYSLQPLETNPPALQALKVQRGTGNPDWLWLEYRQPIGNYDWTLYGAYGQVTTGALIHYEDPNTSGYTRLLDFTPGDGSWYNPALAAGQSWTDGYSNVALSVLSASPNSLSVSVDFGAVPCTPAAPTIVVSPLNPSIYAGQTASYAVSVTNNDSSACSASTINLGSSEPAGWSTSMSATALTLSSGQTAAVTLGKGAPAGTPVGTYAVDMTAANSSATTTDTANATVVMAPSVSATLSVSGTTFSARQSVTLSVTVLSGGVAVKGATVSFLITKADGSTVAKTVTTNRSGVASFSYRIAQTDPKGLWSGSASVTPTSSSSAGTQPIMTNLVSFTVR